MRPALGRVIDASRRAVTGALPPTPSIRALRVVRASAAASARERHHAHARSLLGRIGAGDRTACEEYGALAELALAEMREDVLRRAHVAGARALLLARMHERWSTTEQTEYVDDPSIDRSRRVDMIASLDEINTMLGCYSAFFRALEPLLVRGRETRVLDLAAGHGGFALEASRIARRRGIRLAITATDLKPEYLALGRTIAEQEGLPVRFAVQDALDLSSVPRGEHDIVVCTQSLHHFTPSGVARMFQEALAIAQRGVVLIDGCRSASLGVLVPVLAALHLERHEMIHDAWVSFRRFFTPEELALLAGLGRDRTIEAEWMAPAHCMIRALSAAP